MSWLKVKLSPLNLHQRVPLRLIVLLLMFLPRPSFGAEIKRIEKGLGDRDVITFYGTINEGDDKKFLNAALLSDDAVVLLESPGGLVRVGIEVGKIIRLKGFDTAVISGSCESACAIAWLGGGVRFMSSNGKVGFHAAYRLNKDGSATESGRANALVGAYLNTLGLPGRAIEYITSAPPNGMNLMSREDAQRFGIPVVFYDNQPKPDSKPTATIADPNVRVPIKNPVGTFTPVPPTQVVPSSERPSVKEMLSPSSVVKELISPTLVKEMLSPSPVVTELISPTTLEPAAGQPDKEDKKKPSKPLPQTVGQPGPEQNPKKMQNSTVLRVCRVNDSNIFFSANLVIEDRLNLLIEKGLDVQVLGIKSSSRISLIVLKTSQDFIVPYNGADRYLLIYYWHWLWGPRVSGTKLAEHYEFIVKSVNSSEYWKFCSAETTKKMTYR